MWGYKYQAKIDSVQNRAIRCFLGVHRFAPNHAIQGDMGWPSSSHRRKLDMCRLWNRLVTMPSSRLPYQVFMIESNMTGNRANNWAREMRKLFDDIELSDVYRLKRTCDLNLVSSSLKYIEEQEWESSRYNKPKLRYYNMVKAIFEPEEYVLSDISKRRRSLIAQLRSGILPLQVEVGRFRNISLCDRVCILCQNGSIEDEFHFVCECSAYSDLRVDMLRKIQNQIPDICTLDPLFQFTVIMADFQKNSSRLCTTSDGN